MGHALLEFSVYKIRKDLEFAVRVSSESCARFDPILIEHPQVPKGLVIKITISDNEGPLSVLALCGIRKKEHSTME